ncbi:MAG: hypothetical protein ABEL76_14095 [Bradymonadaceae bacterium]
MSGLGTLQTAATLGTTALVGAPAFAAPDSEFEGALGAGTYAFPKAGFGRRVVFHQTATALGFWGRYGYEVFSVGLLHDGPCLPFAFDGLAPAFAMSFVDETDARLYVSAGPQFGLFSARFPAGGAQVSVVHERELGWRTDLETRIGYRAILFDMRAAPLRSQFHALRSDLQVDFAGRGGVRPFALVEVLAVLVGGEGQIYGSGQFGVEARW